MPRRVPWPPLTERGVDMLVIAAVWVWAGVSILHRPAGDPDTTNLLEHMAPWLRAVIWFVAAAVGVATAWSPRWHPWGFRVLIWPCALRAAAYFHAWSATWWGPDTPYADPWAILPMIGWAGITWWVLRMAGRAEVRTP